MKTAGLGGGVVAVLLGATSLAAQAVDRAKPPALPPPPALKLPAVQTAALANGLELAVVEMHKVPVVDVQLVLDAGAARDPVDLPGLATFTATIDRKSTRLNSSHGYISYAVFCLKKKKNKKS